MWVLPKNHQLYSAFAQECVASKEDLKELSGRLELQLMWRSKPLSFSIWLGKWNKVWWLRLLFGRILKPSHQNCFTEKYTDLLEDIHVNHFQSLGIGQEKIIQHTYGHTSSQQQELFDLIGPTSKTLSIISTSDMSRSKQTWKNWVTQLRKEYTQRWKLAQAIGENVSSSLRFWPTPLAQSFKSPSNGQQGSPNPQTVIQMWTTPSARDYKDTPGMSTERSDRGGQARLDQLPRQVFQWDKGINNMNGRKTARLNPAWVAQLMGTTLETTFFGCMEMELWNKLQK